MLAIRMQRTGRRGHAQYRLIVQDSRFSPTSGRVVAFVGNYDPHTKKAVVDSEKVAKYLTNGAQPSDRAAKLLQKEGIKLPDWVKISPDKTRKIRNPEKLRRNRPASAAEPESPTETPELDEPKAEVSAKESNAQAESAPEAQTEAKTEAPAEEQVTESESPAITAEEPETQPNAEEPEVPKNA